MRRFCQLKKDFKVLNNKESLWLGLLVIQSTLVYSHDVVLKTFQPFFKFHISIYEMFCLSLRKNTILQSLWDRFREMRAKSSTTVPLVMWHKLYFSAFNGFQLNFTTHLDPPVTSCLWTVLESAIRVTFFVCVHFSTCSKFNIGRSLEWGGGKASELFIQSNLIRIKILQIDDNGKDK